MFDDLNMHGVDRPWLFTFGSSEPLDPRTVALLAQSPEEVRARAEAVERVRAASLEAERRAYHARYHQDLPYPSSVRRDLPA